MSAGPIWLRHGKSRLALHLLREGWGRPLLLLHGLGERTPSMAPSNVESWPGPVYGLDVTGHGDSTVPMGGGYTAEILMGDVDAAVARLGSATVLGRGLGAYLALLIGGARPEQVKGVILTDGPGLVGAGAGPGSPSIVVPAGAPGRSPDPYALVELSSDVRPPDYAVEFVRQTMQLSPLEHPISVCAVVRPEWLAAVVAEPGVTTSALDEALERYAEASWETTT